MLSTAAGWLLAVVVVSVVWVVVLIRKGPATALGVATVLSFSFPTWVEMDIVGFPFDVRTSVAALALLGYSVHPRGKIISPLTPLDFCVEFLYLTHVAADVFATGHTWGLWLQAYGEWYVPYLAGRFAIRDKDSLREIAPWVVGVLVVMAVASCVESIAGVNPYELAFGERPAEMAYRSMSRLGLKRAFGPTTHAIFFGMLMAILTPWLMSAWQAYQQRQVRVVIALAGIVTLAGLVCTISRTPVLTVFCAIAIGLALRYRVLRWPLAITVATAVAVFAAFPNQVIDTVSRWTGGGDKLSLMEVDGDVVEYSGARSRLVVLKIYSEAVLKGGLLGYGTVATTGFPPRIPYLEGKTEVTKYERPVDNAYVLFMLRFGWTGGLCLLLLLFTTVVTSLSLRGFPVEAFAGAVACLFTVIAFFSFLLVFMNYDFGFPLFWTMGIVAGLAVSRTRQRRSGMPFSRR